MVVKQEWLESSLNRTLTHTRTLLALAQTMDDPFAIMQYVGRIFINLEYADSLVRALEHLIGGCADD